MIVTLDNLATRYHCLPSEAMTRATTFDLHVLDVATRWSNRQHEMASTGRAPVPQLSQERMLDMIQRVRERQA